MTVVGAVLAAGSASRLGRPKQLLALGASGTLVRSAANATLEAGCARVAVILGAFGASVARSLEGLRVDLVQSSAFHEGIAASIRAATAWAEDARAGALLLTVCDQPHLDAEHLRALIATSEQGARLTASAYAGTVGVPAVFPRRSFAELLALQGDRGAAGLLRSASEVARVPWPAGAIDLDTVVDVERFERGHADARKA